MSLAWLALAWLAYAALHSVLASLAVKGWFAHRWPAAAPWYRIAFNSVAVIAALPLIWFTYTIPSETLWRWSGIWRWLGNALTLAALMGFVVSARAYDMDEFLGLRQIKENHQGTADCDPFTISFFHRFVRHPWYCFALVIVWTRDMDAPMLVSAAAITLYFAIGSVFEERKLLALHGEAYRRYMSRVPGLLPLPWKYLKNEEVEALR